MPNDLLEQDIKAIIEAGGSDADVENYLKTNGVNYSVNDEIKRTGEIISPRSAREEKAKSRGGSFDWFGNIKKGEEEQIATGKPSFIGSLKRGFQTPFAALSGAANVAESTLSDIALGVTERRPQDIPRHLAETFTGKRTAKASDVAESMGAPEGLIANTIGLAAVFGLADLPLAGRMTKGAFGIGKKGAKAIGGGISKVVEVTKDGFQSLKGLKYTFKPLVEEITNLRGTKAEKISNLVLNEQRARYNLNQLKNTTQEVFDNNLKILKDKFQTSYEEGALKFQEALPEYSRNMHKTYKAMSDELAQNLELRRGRIKLSEVNNILLKSQEEAKVGGYDFGKGYQEIDNFLTGKYKATSSNLNKEFDFQQVKNDINKVSNIVNYDRYGKTTDMPVHFLNKHWGKFITDETKNVYGISEYEQMQNWYSQNIDAMKLADKIFKPKQGELFSKEGADYLKKFGEAVRPSLAQEKFLKIIQEGNELVPGVGNLSQPIKQYGEEVRNLEVANKLMKDNISQRLAKLGIKSSEVRNSLTKEFNKRIDELSVKVAERKKAFIVASILGLGSGLVAGVKKISQGFTSN